MHMPEVHLKSGGYIVINSTEALVAIDVNSGKATRERNIEETALKTNIEAAEEIARQLRLRDLAGLIVIDFIDMEVHRNNSKVERVLKDAMRSDRARIQIGRISPFGLLEMSRQRLRPSLLEMHSEPCPHCSGTGIRRSSDTSALHVLRAIEEEATRRRNSEITVHVSSEIALYILNQKRDQLTRIETDYQLRVFIESDDSLIPPDHRMDRVRSDGNTVEESNDEEDTTNAEEPGRKRRRRRGRRRGKRDDEQNENVEANEASEAEEDEENREASDPEADGDDENAKPSRRRRRGRRAGRKRGRKSEEENAVAAEGNEESSDDSETPSEAKTEPTEKDTAVEADADAEEKPRRRPRRRKPAAEKTEAKAETKTETETNEGSADDASSSDESASTEPSPLIEVKVEEPAPTPESEAENPVVSDTPAETARTTVIDVSSIAEEEKPTKRGWWRRG